MDFSEITAVQVAMVSCLVVICIYILQSMWNHYRYLADMYYEILKIGIKYPDFLDPNKTNKYKFTWGSNPTELLRYGAYAQMCWAHAEDIYDAKLPIKKGCLRKLYSPTFERYRELHYVWLQNNASMFPMGGFFEFVESRKWRKNRNCYSPLEFLYERWEQLRRCDDSN